MLLPDKHISLGESLLGLGAFIIEELRQPRSIDWLHERVEDARQTNRLPGFHDFDSLLLAILFLYTLDAIEMTKDGAIRRCAS